ncbi:hypothetical protein V2J09_003536 [Rumex salicifolius]
MIGGGRLWCGFRAAAVGADCGGWGDKSRVNRCSRHILMNMKLKKVAHPFPSTFQIGLVHVENDR